MNKLFKEILLWVLLILPYAYLLRIWSDLPDRVAIHFNIKGQANDWSNKTTLLFVPLIGLVVYLLMLIVPHLDSNKRIAQMGEKYYSLRFIMGLFISLITTYLVFLCKEGNASNPGLLITLSGGIIALLGNFFKL